MSGYSTNDGVAITGGMTLIASWGGGTSNSYIGVTDASSFLETSVVDNTDWTSATAAQKAAALLEATRDIDSRSYVGNRKYYVQLLEFPRQLGTYPWDSEVAAPSEMTVSETRMKQDVERATCHQALFILQNSSKNRHTELLSSGVRGYTKTVGPITEQYTYAADAISGQRALCPQALQFLSDWMSTRRILRG